MADKPLASRDLVESILELRSEAERRLMQNKYYLVIKKLDELLDVIQPFDAEVIEESAPTARNEALTGNKSQAGVPLQQRLATESPPAPAESHDWWRESSPPASPQEPRAEAEAAPEPPAADDDMLTLDERHERPAEVQAQTEDAEFVIEEDKRALQRAEFGV